MDRKPVLISLYSGAGGLDYGFEEAGFRTGVAVEMDHDCCDTLRANRTFPVIEKSIFDVPTGDMLAAARTKRGKLDLVIGGPPCQPFSKSGYWARGDTKRLEDPRAGTLGAYMRVVEEALPRAFVLENVEGLAYTEKNEGLTLVLDMIEQINRRQKVHYIPSFRVLCAADFGVPQLRYRLFLIASREGQPFSFPSPTHAPKNETAQQTSLLALPPYRTAWDALGDLRVDPSEELEMRGKWARLLPSIPEGENYLWHTDRGGGMPLFGWRRRFWSFLLKLAKDRPSWTIQAQPGPGTGPFHWANRRLSMRELCRLQTFPDDVHIQGNDRAIQRQVGNAVPSLLAEILGRAVRTQLLGDARSREPLHLMPPIRTPVPPPEPVRPVPQEYRSLRGVHHAHPGTGKGHRAVAWAEEAQ
ncbi:DNA cytosine methyltransferase [Polyangium sorediatum]|uniref:Cytosine-specific methyltransferase n=1 Tax=Polyangium sorediatum TaxID=889274 RepID=A0ABT6NIN8_9BACT|nr:DNA cytosine methyltransferase [Polyangium sorediatum]MDI1428117.1 DNA cytosine methyltransferase [Polyangium sorediatum]